MRSQPYTNPLSTGTLDTCVTQLAVSTVLLALKYVPRSLSEYKDKEPLPQLNPPHSKPDKQTRGQSLLPDEQVWQR